jgi:hypothetical protein
MRLVGIVGALNTRLGELKEIFTPTPEEFDLDHESQATTRVYIHTVAVKRDKHSDRIARPVGRRKIESSNNSE